MYNIIYNIYFSKKKIVITIFIQLQKKFIENLTVYKIMEMEFCFIFHEIANN